MRIVYEAEAAKLRQASEAAEQAIEPLAQRGDLAGMEGVSEQLEGELQSFEHFSSLIPRNQRLVVFAEWMLESLTLDESGALRMQVPKGVGDRDALMALNAFMDEYYPRADRPAVAPKDFAKFLKISPPTGEVERRDLERPDGQARHITIIISVPETHGKSREEQQRVLTAAGLEFAQPIEQALALGALACLKNQEDPDELFRGGARGAEPGLVVSISSILGAYCYQRPDSAYPGNLFASGVPLRSKRFG